MTIIARKGHCPTLYITVFCLAFVAFQLLLLRAFPAEAWNEETLVFPATVAEYLRGAVAWRDLSEYQNTDLTQPELLLMAGAIRLLGESPLPVFAYCLARNLLWFICWLLAVNRLWGRRTVLPAGLLLLATTPAYAQLSWYCDERMLNGSLCLALLACLLAYGFHRPGWRLAVLTAFVVYACVLYRGFLLLLPVLGIFMPVTSGRHAWRSLLVGLATGVLVAAAAGEVQLFWLVHNQSIGIAGFSWQETGVLLQRLGVTWMTGLDLPPVLAMLHTLMLAVAVVLLLLVLARRGRKSCPGDMLAGGILLFGVLHLAAVMLLRYVPGMDNGYDPVSYSHRHVVFLAPLAGILIARGWERLLGWYALVPVLVLCLGTVVAYPLRMHFLWPALDEVQWTEYVIMGEQIGGRVTAENAATWQVRLLRLRPEHRAELAEGLGITAMRPDRTPEDFRRLAALADSLDTAAFYRSAGYWSACFRPAEDVDRCADDWVPAAFHATFRAGHAAYDPSRLDWWQTYNRARGMLPPAPALCPTAG